MVVGWLMADLCWLDDAGIQGPLCWGYGVWHAHHEGNREGVFWGIGWDAAIESVANLYCRLHIAVDGFLEEAFGDAFEGTFAIDRVAMFGGAFEGGEVGFAGPWAAWAAAFFMLQS
jgi:hypothetical protein